jgi:hypothetical protein
MTTTYVWPLLPPTSPEPETPTSPAQGSTPSGETALTAGTEQETAARVIRKHLSPALAGPNWDALIEALSRGDEINFDNARAAFDQLFKSSASGQYLDRLAANDGLERPDALGLSDELFRLLSTRFTNEKLTHNAIRQILEVFYGRDALSAWVETEAEGPFALIDGDTLDLLIDETTDVTITFNTEQFATISNATSTEIAAVITKTLGDARLHDAVAKAFVDPISGGSKVKIYSPSLGLKSFVRVQGGSAQPVLQFSTLKDVYAADVSGSGYSWVFSTPTQNVTRMTLTTTGLPLIDVSGLEAGDYVVVGPAASPVPAGTYQILDVAYSWSGADYIQSIDLDGDLDVTGSQAQSDNSAYTFFAPTKKTVLNGERTVVVAQTSNGKIDVQFPATTQAVTREPGLAAYGHDGTELAIKRYLRDANGTLTVELETPATLTVGSTVHIAGIKSSSAKPWISNGTPGTHPAVGLSDGSYGTTWSATQVPPTALNEYTEGVVLANGDLMVIGGTRAGTSRQSCGRFRLVGTSTVIDGSEAAGSVRRTYQWIATANMTNARASHAASMMVNGKVLATGGNSASRFGANTQQDVPEIYDPVADTWSAGSAMLNADAGGTGERQNHTQNSLSTGKVLVAGGSWNDGTASERTHLFDPFSSTWNPYSPASRMSEYRTNHQAITLLDGRVFIVGGQALGRTEVLTNTLAYWPMDDVSGATITDISGSGFNLTVSGTANIIDGKVNRARDFGGTGTATVAGSAPATAALVGLWTVDFWLLAPYGDGVVLSYGGPTEILADNILLEVGVASERVFWRWEYDAGVDQGFTQSTGPAIGSFANGCYITVRKSAADRVDLFINGEFVQSWSGIVASNGGSAGAWYVNRSAEGGSQYDAAVDEIRVSTVVRTNDEIRRSYLRSKGWVSNGAFASSETLNSTEFYDPVAMTTSPGPKMVWNRAFHKAIRLTDGRVLVVGGTGYRNDRPLATYNDTYAEQWPNNGISEFEIWDPKTNSWSVAGVLGQRWVDPNVVQVGSKVWISSPSVLSYVPYDGGSTSNSSGLEVIDLTTMKSSGHFVGFQAARDRGFAVGDVALFTGGNAAGVTHTTADLLIPGADTIGASGINGEHRVVTSTTGSFTVSTPDHKHYASNFGDSSLARGGLTWSSTTDSYAPATTTNAYPISLADRTSNVATVTVPSTAGLVVGQRVFVNFVGSVGISSGYKTITVLTGTTISWADPGADVLSGAVGGAISVNSNDTATAASLTATSDSIEGPYLYDESSVAVTGVVSTLTTAVRKSQRVTSLSVASTADFPDTGYLVLGFGYATQSKPVRLIQKIDATTLLVDYGFVPEHDYAVGTSVEYLVDRNGFVVDGDAMFYATASSAGRVAAQATTSSAAAAGIEVDFTVVYPGDRGLGGEGYPTEASESQPKVSDVTKVWGE